MDVDAACPKCGRVRLANEEACARCGLLVAHFAAYSSTVAAEPAELTALWEAAAAAWDDDGAHEKLLGAATAMGQLPLLARRYGERTGDPRAAKQLSRIATLVESAARIEGKKVASPRASRLLWAAGYAVAALVLAVSAWFVARVFFRR